MNLLDTLGLPVNFKKVEKPQTKITCLGIDIDAKTGTLTIPNKRRKFVHYVHNGNRKHMQQEINLKSCWVICCTYIDVFNLQDYLLIECSSYFVHVQKRVLLN